MPERIQIVDENDHITGVATRQEAWEKGLYYRLVQVVLRDENGNFLLQKRSLQKSFCPGRWTNAASGHVDEGETYETSASRELAEEIGIKAELTFVGKVRVNTMMNNKKINQFNGVFEGKVSRHTEFALQPEEVSEIRWFTLADLKEKVKVNPDEFTPAFVEILKLYC
jgi:isopentenyl-diphosphate Delta-isomerase